MTLNYSKHFRSPEFDSRLLGLKEPSWKSQSRHSHLSKQKQLRYDHILRVKHQFAVFCTENVQRPPLSLSPRGSRVLL